jgi:lon-related putative ATP-dependent protease
MPVGPLLPQQLYRVCDCEEFNFTTTDDLQPLDRVPGQERALEAVVFAAEMPHPDYHLYLLGEPGTGRHLMALRLFEVMAAEMATPADWVYVHSFKQPHAPRAISLPSGRGPAFAAALRGLVEDVRTAIPATFERVENQRRLQAVEEEFRHRQEQAFEALSEEAKTAGLALLRTPQGFLFAPLKDGEPLPPEEAAKLPKEEQDRLAASVRELQAKLKELMQQSIPRWDKERRTALAALNREIIANAIAYPLGEMRGTVGDVTEAVEFLDELRADLLEHFPLLFASEQQPPGEGKEPQPFGAAQGLRRYEVNVLVTNRPDSGAPVVYEDNPTFLNLIGRAEHLAQMGTLVTDFTLLKGGALHRANGGFLVLDVEKLLMQPLAWEALKRNLRSEHVAIDPPADYYSPIATVSLRPEPIPLKVRIALVGPRHLFHLLQQYDPDFASMFKVAAEFSETMTRTRETDESFARLIATMVRQSRLLPFEVTAVGRIIEASSRQAEDSRKLSLLLRDLHDLLREADFFARRRAAKAVSKEDVSHAIAARIRRADRIRELSHEAITRNIMLIETAGSKTGQINGLSVLQLGHFSFGKPTRITVALRMGQGRVIDIEREVKLGGPLHSKGVLILQGFLAGRFLPGQPLSLSASLVFEQSYGGVDGDSASSTELYALLSALAELPIDQGLAVTGSVNQKGEVQAIGGVNEKIEGFFDICRARGLNGKQGVLIPRANIDHLMLREDVVGAAANAEFHIYPIATVEEGIELLTGRAAGERDGEGRYPPDSVYGLVEARLASFAAERRTMSGGS